MAQLNCDDEALTQLRKAVVGKYGQLHGFLKKEVYKALKARAEKILEKNNDSTK
jgi:hypothetical protein